MAYLFKKGYIFTLSMISITFRQYNFKFKEIDGKKYIFDEIRKKYVFLSPEEWVRQHIVHHLIKDLNYSKNRIALEKEFIVNHHKRRFDILVFTENMDIFMLIECKAPDVFINQKIAQQLFNYNVHYNAKYLLLTNGMNSFCLDKDKKWLEQLPLYI